MSLRLLISRLNKDVLNGITTATSRIRVSSYPGQGAAHFSRSSINLFLFSERHFPPDSIPHSHQSENPKYRLYSYFTKSDGWRICP
jgi:hypothetical protein